MERHYIEQRKCFCGGNSCPVCKVGKLNEISTPTKKDDKDEEDKISELVKVDLNTIESVEYDRDRTLIVTKYRSGTPVRQFKLKKRQNYYSREYESDHSGKYAGRNIGGGRTFQIGKRGRESRGARRLLW